MRSNSIGHLLLCVANRIIINEFEEFEEFEKFEEFEEFEGFERFEGFEGFEGFERFEGLVRLLINKKNETYNFTIYCFCYITD